MSDDVIKERFQSIIQALNKCHSKTQRRKKLVDLDFEFFSDNGSDPDIEEEKMPKQLSRSSSS